MSDEILYKGPGVTVSRRSLKVGRKTFSKELIRGVQVRTEDMPYAVLGCIVFGSSFIVNGMVDFIVEFVDFIVGMVDSIENGMLDSFLIPFWLHLIPFYGGLSLVIWGVATKHQVYLETTLGDIQVMATAWEKKATSMKAFIALALAEKDPTSKTAQL